MESNDIQWYPMVVNGFQRYTIVSDGIQWFPILCKGVQWYSMVSNYIQNCFFRFYISNFYIVHLKKNIFKQLLREPEK